MPILVHGCHTVTCPGEQNSSHTIVVLLRFNDDILRRELLEQLGVRLPNFTAGTHGMLWRDLVLIRASVWQGHLAKRMFF